MAQAIIAGALAVGIGTYLGRLVVNVLVGLGISAITYVGVSAAVGYLEDFLQGAFHNLPSTVLGVIVYCEVPKAISMIFGSYVAASATGAFRKIVFRKAP